jgi:hypothetical protein
LLQQSGPSFSQSTRHGDSVDPELNHGAFHLPRLLAVLSVHNSPRRLRPCAAAVPALSQGIAPPSAEAIAARMEVFNAPVPGSVYALQPFLNAQEVTTVTARSTG